MLAAVHHAEVVAHRVGEPFGSLVLAVAVTVIEVGLIVALRLAGGPQTASLATDTVFAAVMITRNGILGLSLLAGAVRHRLVSFNAEGSGAGQVGINLALGSAMTSIGLTIPVIVVFSVWLDGPLLGLGATQNVLPALTVVVASLTIVPGRATRLQGVVHLVLLAAFPVLAANP